jgi:hypothetical protein
MVGHHERDPREEVALSYTVCLECIYAYGLAVTASRAMHAIPSRLRVGASEAHRMVGDGEADRLGSSQAHLDFPLRMRWPVLFHHASSLA